MDDQCQWSADGPHLAAILNSDTQLALLDYGPALGSRVAFAFHAIVNRYAVTEYRFDYEDPELPADAIF